MFRYVLHAVTVATAIWAPLGAVNIICDNESYTVAGERYFSVEELKLMLEKEIGITASHQSLFEGKHVLNDSVLIDVAKDNDLFLLVKTTVGNTLYRDYNRQVTTALHRDINFIITTMANKAAVKLVAYRKELVAAGDRIDHIHPLRFLMEIFSDEETKVGLRVLRKKGWVWEEFFSGLSQSLSEEFQNNNITNEQIQHFSGVLKVNPRLVFGPIQSQSWVQLIDVLIANIPRSGDSGRHDM